jgi:ABC-2 type transport system ATP-binding protein
VRGARLRYLPSPMPAIRTAQLRKVFPPASGLRPLTGGWVPLPTAEPPEAPRQGAVTAVDGLDLEVAAGEFVGMLGPNGAGKTTTIGILTTRIRATSGRAEVAGADVASDPVGVRQRIGVVPQRPNPDRALNVEENLLFHAAYFGIADPEARGRAGALLDLLGLAEKRLARVDALSGGQQQRLMIARALIHEPDVLFLDEPTVGLDPQARRALWEILRRLHGEGRTVVMTTHYMEEADQLCDRVAIMDRGRLLAFDTPAALKARAPGGTVVELHLDGPAGALVAAAGGVPGVTRAEATDGVLRVYAARGGEVVAPLIQAAAAGGRVVHDIKLLPPSLETLFIALTGRTIE